MDAELLLQNLRRIELCTMVVEEVQRDFATPISTEDKADILIAVEELAQSTLELLLNVRQTVWQDSPTPNQHQE